MNQTDKDKDGFISYVEFISTQKLNPNPTPKGWNNNVNLYYLWYFNKWWLQFLMKRTCNHLNNERLSITIQFNSLASILRWTRLSNCYCEAVFRINFTQCFPEIFGRPKIALRSLLSLSTCLMFSCASCINSLKKLKHWNYFLRKRFKESWHLFGRANKDHNWSSHGPDGQG